VSSHDACLCHLLGLDEAPDEWGAWLAARNLRVTVERQEPGAGFWIARDERQRCAVMFGTPPGIVWDPGDGFAPPVSDALSLVPLDARLPIGRLPGPPAVPVRGVVAAIFISAAAGEPAVSVTQAQAVPGRGLQGDRYAAGRGTFSSWPGPGRALTLVEAEVLDAIELPGSLARRNVVTRHVDLNALVGRRFRIGTVECLGARWCEPCAHLQRLTRPGVLRDLVHRGGLRADILSAGTMGEGDAIRA